MVRTLDDGVVHVTIVADGLSGARIARSLRPALRDEGWSVLEVPSVDPAGYEDFLIWIHTDPPDVDEPFGPPGSRPWPPVVWVAPDGAHVPPSLLESGGGIVTADDARRSIVDICHAVLSGLTVVSPALAETRRHVAAETALTGEALTAAELAVFERLTAGMANEKIAAAIGISVNTVKYHLASIYRKLGVRNRTEAVARSLSPPSTRFI